MNRASKGEEFKSKERRINTMALLDLQNLASENRNHPEPGSDLSVLLCDRSDLSVTLC